MIEKIVSGGQTGVDRAALDVALDLGLSAGGWCPRGRGAEDGAIPERYPLQETGTADAAERTRLNVRDSDATLIVCLGPLTGGTRLTRDIAIDLGRPHHVVDLDGGVDAALDAAAWLAETGARTLNVAGPRESGRPGIHAEARAFLARLLARPDVGAAIPKRS